MKVRYYQFGALLLGGFFYMFVYRQFLAPKPVVNSISYNQALKFAENNRTLKKLLGQQYQVMSCNGKIYPYK